MRTVKTTMIWIENIEGIDLIKPEKYREENIAECRLIIDCGNNESIDLILTASHGDKLKFNEIKGLTDPKIYRGKSMSEEE